MSRSYDEGHQTYASGRNKHGYYWWYGRRVKRVAELRYTRTLVNDVLAGDDGDIRDWEHDQRNRDALSLGWAGIFEDKYGLFGPSYDDDREQLIALKREVEEAGIPMRWQLPPGIKVTI